MARSLPTLSAKLICYNRKMQETTPFVIKPSGKQYYIVAGHLVPRKRFEQMYPINIIAQRPNSCKKGIWMSDVKSY